ncbi:MAG: carbamate kinase, partial [Myxococcota bacterium]
MRVVVALGGNALLRRGEPLTLEALTRNARVAAEALARLSEHHEIVVTHGNGPQVGLLALQAAALLDGPVVPLDVLGAESEGMIGYLLQRELTNQCPGRVVATLLTQTVVDSDDPAFEVPTKPIGPLYDAPNGLRLAGRHGWTVRPDGDGVRRVVPSPAPLGIVELPAIRALLDRKILVICAGGGGVPVQRDGTGRLVGVEAVVDKDATSAMLARAVDADVLLLLTDVDAVYEGWPRRDRPLGQVRASELAGRAFDPGSMGPKVAAARAFVMGGGRAAIGALGDAAAVLDGVRGTTVVPEGGAA